MPRTRINRGHQSVAPRQVATEGEGLDAARSAGRVRPRAGRAMTVVRQCGEKPLCARSAVSGGLDNLSHCKQTNWRDRSESRRRARAQPLILRSNASLARGRRSLVGRLVARRTAEPGRPQVLGANLKCSESGCLVVEDLYGVSTAPLLTDLRG
jgi:hypothetical protein